MEMKYEMSVDEIYSLKILPNTIRPNILNTINSIHKYSLSIPGQTFWANPDEVGKIEMEGREMISDQT